MLLKCFLFNFQVCPMKIISIHDFTILILDFQNCSYKFPLTSPNENLNCTIWHLNSITFFYCDAWKFSYLFFEVSMLLSLDLYYKSKVYFFSISINIWSCILKFKMGRFSDDSQLSKIEYFTSRWLKVFFIHKANYWSVKYSYNLFYFKLFTTLAFFNVLTRCYSCRYSQNCLWHISLGIVTFNQFQISKYMTISIL